MKSDYDQERLLQQLMLSETLHLRIKKGAAQIPDLLSPWTNPDTTKLPQVQYILLMHPFNASF